VLKKAFPGSGKTFPAHENAFPVLKNAFPGSGKAFSKLKKGLGALPKAFPKVKAVRKALLPPIRNETRWDG